MQCRAKVIAALLKLNRGNMKNLELWSEYSGEQIHSIFSPDTVFTPKAGT